MKSFVSDLPPDQTRLINGLRNIIKQQDACVTEKPGKIMAAKNALCYLEQDVFKYGLTQTKTGFSFHSMVMYAHRDVLDFARTRLTRVKVQKGCINIPSLETLDLVAFEKMLQLSAEKDFSPVIAHYKGIPA